MTAPSAIALPVRHVPVLLDEVLAALQPRAGETYVDGTFGAGGYARAMLQAALCNVIGIDRDPEAIAAGAAIVAEFGGRLRLHHGAFNELAAAVGGETISGVVLDIGVSSMQLDDGARGFSFRQDGPLDMRMAKAGRSAADEVNQLPADALANIIYVLGEEPRSRAIARAIEKERALAPLVTTFDPVRAVERATGPQRAKDRTHPATRTFQALRIYVNGELTQLAEALCAAERILVPGGRLVVVTFHSLEDRIVKKFFAARAGQLPSASRHMPGNISGPEPSFTLPHKGHVEPTDEEMERNPRARSAKLRMGIRTAAAFHTIDMAALGVPTPELRRH